MAPALIGHPTALSSITMAASRLTYGSNNFYETGCWDVSRDVIQIDFDGDERTDFLATIRSFTSNHLCIDVNDLYYGSRYTLTLSRW